MKIKILSLIFFPQFEKTNQSFWIFDITILTLRVKCNGVNVSGSAFNINLTSLDAS